MDNSGGTWTEKDSNICVDGKDIRSKECQEDKDKKSGSEGPSNVAGVILVILVAVCTILGNLEYSNK